MKIHSATDLPFQTDRDRRRFRRSHAGLLILVVVGVGLPLGALTLGGLRSVRDDREQKQLVEHPLYRRTLGKAMERLQTRLGPKYDLHIGDATWEKPFRAIGEHYVVETTSSPVVANSVMNRVETMLPRIQALLGTSFKPTEPLRIRVYPDRESYNRAGNNAGDHSSRTGTFYDPSVDAAVITYIENNLNGPLLWGTHGAVHQFLDQAFPGRTPPTWVGEGLAGYFEWEWNEDHGWKVLKAQQERGAMANVATLLGTSMGSSYREEYLLQTGLLFHYLLDELDATRTTEDRAPFRDWLRQCVRGSVGGQPTNIGGLSIAEINRGFRAFVLQTRDA